MTPRYTLEHLKELEERVIEEDAADVDYPKARGRLHQAELYNAALDCLIAKQCEYFECGNNIIEIKSYNKIFVYATTSGRWKVKGRGDKWYRSKSIENFLETYVSRNKSSPGLG